MMSNAGCVVNRPAHPKTVSWTHSTLADAELDDQEQSLWQDAETLQAELMEAGAFLDAPELETYLSDIVSSIAPQMPESGPKIRVSILADTDRNAYASPNGDILISASLLASLENEAQLVFLLGHEISHIVRRDSLTSSIYSDLAPSHVDRMLLSRKIESNADHDGFGVLTRAGYDPKQASLALEHLKGQSPPARRISSWDSHEDIHGRIRTLLVKANEHPKNGQSLKPEFSFLKQIDAIRLSVAQLEIDAGSLSQAKTRIQEHLHRDHTSSTAHYMLAQVIRKLSPERSKDPLVERHYRLAVNYAPEDPVPLRALGLLLRRVDQKDESTRLLKRYLDLKPDAEDRKLIERYIQRDANPEL